MRSMSASLWTVTTGNGVKIVFTQCKGVLPTARFYTELTFTLIVDNKAECIVDTSDRMYKITKICHFRLLPEQGSNEER
jgi:hypothetical protein